MKKHKEASEGAFLTGIILSMICWGLAWASGKVLVSFDSALHISIYRFLLTSVSLIILIIVLKENLLISRQAIPALLGATLCISAYTVLYFKGLQHGHAGAGGVLVTTINPVLTYVILLIIQRRKPNTFEITGLLCGLLAGFVLLKGWDSFHIILQKDNLYFLMAIVAWSFLSLITAKAGKFGSVITFSLWMYTIATLALLPFSDTGKLLLVFQINDCAFWGNLFFSSTITTSLATTFYFYATSRLGAGKASVFIFIVPFTAALGAWFFLGETLHIHTVAGGLLGIAAIYLINNNAFRKP